MKEMNEYKYWLTLVIVSVIGKQDWYVNIESFI